MLLYRDDDPVESRASSLDADGLVIQYQAINHDADQQLILLLDQEVSVLTCCMINILPWLTSKCINN